MAVCEHCNKQRSFGHNVSHAKNRTNRRWVPNTQNTRISINGVYRTARVCTRCLRTLSKTEK